MKMLYRSLFLLLVSLVVTSVYAETEQKPADWRKSNSSEVKLKNLVALTPGTHHWMVEIGYRYQTLYWAAKTGKWQFAEYQSKSLEKKMKTVAKARTKRAPSMAIFRKNVFPGMHKATQTKDWKKFEKAFNAMAGECMACHVREGFGFITVPTEPVKPGSLVLGL